MQTRVLSIDPPNIVVIVDTATEPVTPATVKYKVLAGAEDVSTYAKLDLQDTTIGSISGTTFTSTLLPDGVLGKTSQVMATLANYQAAVGNLSVVQLRKTGPQRDFFFIVPYDKEPAPPHDTLKFIPKIRQVDVAFSMDTTGSMGTAITNLSNALEDVFDDLKVAIPDVGIAVVDYRDYPYSDYGSTGDWPVKIWQKVTTNINDAKNATNKWAAGGGGDAPESDIQAMYHILTGEPLRWPNGGRVEGVEPTPGYWGAVDFRPGAVPVVVNITDQEWHDDYSFQAPRLAMLQEAFFNHNAFFVNITSYSDEIKPNRLSDAANSNLDPSAFAGICEPDMCCTGAFGASRRPDGPNGRCRLNFRHEGGNGVSDGVITAIQAIAAGAAYDVHAVISNDEANPGGVDATQFIAGLRAMDEGNENEGCPPMSAVDTNDDGINDTFVSVTVGTPICFEVIAQRNTIVPATDQAQFFKAFVDVMGLPGSVKLDRREVLFLVPPKDVGVN